MQEKLEALTVALPAKEVTPPYPPLHSTNPEEIIQRAVRRRDISLALTLLMRHYGDKIYRLCKTFTDVSVDDVHQQIFFEAYQTLNKPGFVVFSTYEAWLCTLARHRCLDAKKRERRWWERFKRESSGEKPDPAPSVPEVLTQQQQRSVLADCLQALNENIRLAVLLRYQQGLSYEEMSKVYGERPGTLQQRVARALPLLKTCVEKKMGA
jgi:RNA polymerase sigma factor (sigma-70 family)